MTIDIGYNYILRDFIYKNIIWTITDIIDKIEKPEYITCHSYVSPISVQINRPLTKTFIIVSNEEFGLEYELDVETFIDNFKEYR